MKFSVPTQRSIVRPHRLVLATILAAGCAAELSAQEDTARIAPPDIAEVVGQPNVEDEFAAEIGRPGSLRRRLADAGLATGGSIIWDGSQNLRGGLDTQAFASRYLLNLFVLADLETWIGVPRSIFYLDLQNIEGTPGQELVGDFQVFSNIDAPRRVELSRAWLETFLVEDRLRLKVGKIDGNTDFAFALSGGSFLNSSMGFSPTIFVMPTYPDPTLAVVMDVTSDGYSDDAPNGRWAIRGGVFDGVGADGVPFGRPLFTGKLDPLDELFYISEGDVGWGSLADGDFTRLLLGIYHHDGLFDRFDGGVDDGVTGYYAVADRQLFNEGDCEEHQQQGLSAFAQFGYANPDVSQAARHYGGGLTWTGLIPDRDTDIAGIGITSVEFSKQSMLTARNETAYEAFYQYFLSPRWSTVLDLQTIHNPGGLSEVSTAVVTTLRVIGTY